MVISMEFEIYKVTIVSGENPKVEPMTNLITVNEISAREFCKQHELSLDGFKETYFPVPV